LIVVPRLAADVFFGADERALLAVPSVSVFGAGPAAAAAWSRSSLPHPASSVAASARVKIAVRIIACSYWLEFCAQVSRPPVTSPLPSIPAALKRVR